MQRRAAAIYFGIFLLVGAGAYGFIQVGTTQPQVDLGTEEYAQGDTLQVGGQTYTISKLARTEAEGGHGGGQGPIQMNIAYTNESAGSTTAERAIEGVSEGSNITLGGVQHLVHFTGDDSVQIAPTDQVIEEYNTQNEVQDYWLERIAGLWGVIFVSFFAAVFLLAAAYMPVKD